MQYLMLLMWMIAGTALADTDGAPAIHFDISSYTVQGATLMDKAKIAAAVAPYAGKNKDFSDVQNAVQAIQALYAKGGYTAVQVLLPEQELDKGKVNIRVIESRYGQVNVQGQKYFSADNVRYALPSLREGAFPNSKLIARELKLANENPARHVDVVLKAGQKPEQVDADVHVNDQNPVSWGVTFDNTGSTETGHTRLGLSYRNANVRNADDVANLQLQVSPQHMNRVRVFGAGYKIPLYSRGDSVEFFAGHSTVNSTVGGLSNFQGGGELLNVRYNQMLERMGEFDPRLSWGFDWRDFKKIEQTQPPQPDPLYREIVVTPLSIAVAASRKGVRSQTDFNVGLSANLPMGSKGNKTAFANYDPSGALSPDANYRILRFGASYVQAFGEDWQLRTALTGQWSNNVLVLGEQMRLGGMNGVRGFAEGSEAGEKGARWTLETYTPSDSFFGFDTRGLVFFDGGKVSSRSGLYSSITSAGIGLRASRDKYSARVDVARIGKAGADPQQKSGDWRAHFLLSAQF
jgi:hemolysin activation/secretion protein